MTPLATAAQMKRMDQTAIQERGIPSALLMERAARGILSAVESLAGEGHTAAVFSGPGNNGGDGVAVAGLLRKAGWQVRCFLAGRREKMTDDCREMERRLNETGGILEDYVPGDGEQTAFAMGADVIVDALFGVGLNSPLREPGASAVKLINLSPARVVSADIPSGVEADTGRILGDAVEADVTVTFSMAKPGLYVGKGALRAGKVIVHDIGIPEDIRHAESYEAFLITEELVKGWLPRRPADGHKGDFGKTLIIGGSVGYTGAPVLAARGALRSGAGLVTVLTQEAVYPIVASNCLEAMARPLPGDYLDVLGLAEKNDALLIGPGLGQGPEAAALLPILLQRLDRPLVLDADGINILAGHMDILDRRRKVPPVLTPHDGEFARLGGDLSRGERLQAAREFAVAHGCVLVLKGHNTIVAQPDGQCYVNATGNSGMAKGGSGDVLGGMILSLIGQGLSSERAAVCAVYLHGRAGDLAAADKGEHGMLPTDLIEQIPYAIKELIK